MPDLLTLDRADDGVVVLRMTHDENRFTSGFLDAWDAALDEVEAMEGPVGLVLTGQGRFFSNGLDLETMATEGFDLAGYVERVQQRVFARTLALGMPVSAALNGHAFAAGAMLSLCCDHRVMRADRGFWCLPEADIDIPFTMGMDALCAAGLPTPAVRLRAMAFAERFGGTDAAALGIVQEAVGEDAVLDAASAWVRQRLGKRRETVHVIKRRRHRHVLDELRRTDNLAPSDDPTD